MDAATALAAVSPGDPKVLDILLPAMESPSAPVREAAATTLGRLGSKDPRALKALAGGLRPEDARAFDAAVRALDALKPEGHRAALPALAERLESALKSPEGRVPVALVDALGLCGKQDPERASALLLRALKERGSTLGHACARAFGELGPRALPPLKSLFKERDPELRLLAVSTAARLRPLDAEVVEAVESLSGDSDPRVRGAVLAGLAGLLKDGAPVPLAKVIRFMEDGSGKVRTACAAALGTLPNLRAEGMRTLGAALEDADPDVRRAAIDSIRLQPKGAASMLKELGALLKDADPTMRRLAVETLGAIGPPAKELNKPLVDIAESKTEDPRIRMAAMEALVRINPEIQKEKR